MRTAPMVMIRPFTSLVRRGRSESGTVPRIDVRTADPTSTGRTRAMPAVAPTAQSPTRPAPDPGRRRAMAVHDSAPPRTAKRCTASR